MRKMLSIVLVIVLTIAMGIVVFAEDENTELSDEATTSVADETDSTTEDLAEVDEVEGDNEEVEIEDEEVEIEDEEENDDQDEEENDDQDEADEEGQPKGKAHGFHRNKVIKEERDQLEAQKDAIEVEKDGLEDELESLEEQIEAAEATGEDTSALVEEFNALKENHDQLKSDMKQKIMERRQLIKQAYSTEEMEQVEKATEALDELTVEDETMKVLPVDSIISTKTQFKFDTPPVIKSGRTLVPVRAITEGFGAEVTWDQASKVVGIIKGDLTIELQIDNNEVKVNDEIVALDTQSEIMNSRTYVPLRFISETLGLNISWDEDTETVAIEDNSDSTDAAQTDEEIADDEVSDDTSEEDTADDESTDDTLEEDTTQTAVDETN